MIGGKTPLEYVVQLLILAQPIFFTWLYDLKQIQFPERYKVLFKFIALGFITWVLVSGFEIMFYTTGLWVQYTLFVVISTEIFNVKYPIKEAICLGFLTTFLNSYYWELPLHFADYLQAFPYFDPAVHLPQLWRLYPLVFFLPRFRVREENKKELIYGLMFSVAIMGLIFGLRVPYKLTLYDLNRIVCLFLLTKAFFEAEPKNIP